MAYEGQLSVIKGLSVLAGLPCFGDAGIFAKENLHGTSRISGLETYTNRIYGFKNEKQMCIYIYIPWEPQTFIFRGYNPYIGV